MSSGRAGEILSLKGKEIAIFKGRLLILLFTIAASLALAFYVGFIMGQQIVYSHFFYIPIILTGLWYGKGSFCIAVLLSIVYILITHFSVQVVTLETLDRCAILLIVGYVVGFVRKRQAKTEETVWHDRNRMQEYLDIVGVILVVIDNNGRVNFINKKGCEVLGYKQKEIVGKNWFDNFVPDRIKAEVKIVSQKLLKGEVKSVEYYENPILTKTGEERTIAWHNTVLKDEKGNVVGHLSSGSDITEKKETEEKVAVYQRELRSLASQLTLVEEREKRQLATELHDSIGQLLALCKIKLGQLGKETIPLHSHPLLGEIKGLLDEIIKYTRSLTFQLGPPILYELGLEAALEWLMEFVHKQQGIQVDLEFGEGTRCDNEELYIFLFRAVQELLMNVTKHARISRAKVSVHRENENIYVTVEDAGIGFNVAILETPRDEDMGFGLFSIRERLQYFEGELSLQSKPGQGTRVNLMVPIKPLKKRPRRK